MNLPLVPTYDGNDYTTDELREGISLLQDELDNRDRESFPMLGLENFMVSTADPAARSPEAYQKAVVDALHAYDPWAMEIVSIRTSVRDLIVRYDREFDCNLSFIMERP